MGSTCFVTSTKQNIPNISGEPLSLPLPPAGSPSKMPELTLKEMKEGKMAGRSSRAYIN
jgi:hypothetical protein